jgi:hypothetical protein
MAGGAGAVIIEPFAVTVIVIVLKMFTIPPQMTFRGIRGQGNLFDDPPNLHWGSLKDTL